MSKIRDDESGQVLILVIALLFFVALTVGAIVLMLGTSAVATGRATNVASARGEATAAIDALVGQLEAHPRLLSTDEVASDPLVGHWIAFAPSGSVVPCPGPGSSCVRLTVTYDAGQDGVASAVVTASARVGCAGEAVCADTTEQAVLDRRTYLDYLWFDAHETLVPVLYPPGGGFFAFSSECGTDQIDYHCLNPAFSGAGSSTDTITGPVRTNSPAIYVCGGPVFEGVVETTGAAIWQPGDGGCQHSDPTFARGTQVVAPLPLPTPTQLTDLEAIAGPHNTYTGPTTLIAASGHLVVNGVSRPYPGSGVIYVNGPVSISGVVAGQLSVVATGDITVAGNLTYACAPPGVPVPADCHDVTGLESENDILVSWRPRPLTLDAALLALQGAVYVPLWSLGTPPPGQPVPTLYLDGAIVEDYRGAFGGYASGSDGRITSGYVKDFIYDARLVHLQPPWFLEPVASEWEVASLRQVP